MGFKQTKKDKEKQDNQNSSNGGLVSQMLMNTSLMQQRAKENQAIFGNAIQREENITGIPDNLKSGMESLSGISLDHVKVHYNSSKPASVQAHAYAQGSDIHIASGQEKHLPHELGHVVQQAQGRVKPTTTVGGVAVNDNPALESEATKMGERALQMKRDENIKQLKFFKSNISLQRIYIFESSKEGKYQRTDIDNVDDLANMLNIPIETFLVGICSMIVSKFRNLHEIQISKENIKKEELNFIINKYKFVTYVENIEDNRAEVYRSLVDNYVEEFSSKYGALKVDFGDISDYKFIYESHGDKHFTGNTSQGSQFKTDKGTVNSILEKHIENYWTEIKNLFKSGETSIIVYIGSSDKKIKGQRWLSEEHNSFQIQVTVNAKTKQIDYHGYPVDPNLKEGVGRTQSNIQ